MIYADRTHSLSRSSHARLGVVLMLVLVAVAIATTLAYSFVSSQATTISITRNVENQAQARYIAESGLAIAISYVRNTDTWRDDQSNGVWVASASFGGGTYSIRGEDGADGDGDDVISQPGEGDGDLNDDSKDPLTLTVTGIHDGSTHTVRAVLRPQCETMDQLFWIDKGDKRIYRSELDGSDTQIVVTGVEARDIAIDSVNGKLFWIDKDAKKIRRSDLDGGNSEDVINNVDDGFALAVDPAGGKVYWADKDVEKIRRANLDGSGTQDIVHGAKEVLALEVNATEGKVYWADKDTKRIHRADLDGSNSEQVVNAVNEVPGLAIDSTSSRLYWSNIDKKRIRSSSLTGSAKSNVTSGFESHGIAIHPCTAKLYWSHKDDKSIQRANVDGSDVANIATGLSEPTSIAIGGGGAGALSMDVGWSD